MSTLTGPRPMSRVKGAVTAPMKNFIAESVRSKIAGPQEEREKAIKAIWSTPGPRWFAPGDPIWTVHAHPSMMVGGLRALLVQSLHPSAMAGVAGHSGFRGDPWGRLQRTGNFIATTTYAPIPEAERLLARIRGIHSRVSGIDETGRAYAASDPHLLAWVHAAEADSFLTAYQAYAKAPLSASDADRYVAQMGSVSARLGVVNPPQTTHELGQLLASYRGELEASAAALDAAEFLIEDPPLSKVARVGYRPFVQGALAITPPYVRQLLKLPVPSQRRQALQRSGVRRAVRVLDWAMDHPTHLQLPVGWSHEPAI